MVFNGMVMEGRITVAAAADSRMHTKSGGTVENFISFIDEGCSSAATY